MRNTSTIYTSRRRQNAISSRNYNRNVNFTAFDYTKKIGPVFSAMSFAGIVVILGLIFVQNSARVSTFGSKIQERESKIAELEVAANDLKVENARLTALQTVSNSEVAKTLTTPASVNYAE